MAAEGRQIHSVWTRPQRRRREQPALTRAQIVAEAVALLDTESIEALSMRKLGARLNAGATSLYTHVANKEELIELVADAVFGELADPDPADSRGWRAAILDYAVGLRATILRHPWLASILGEVGTLYLGPNMMRGNEAILTILEEAGFDMKAADHAMNVVFSYVVGIAMTEAASLTVVRRSGLSETEWFEKMWPAAEEAARAYPRLHKRYVAQPASEVSKSRDESFEYEVGLILQGLAPTRR
ncbi:TetR/AcrR family transcriptional regulator [Nocardia sp. GCM10030253]|uniref:TetR/AcrR family transcriptional regulator n=1 Tax=Nocardia sp. GCM10030253 TaxID=3273404 RepID=UPI0036433560